MAPGLGVEGREAVEDLLATPLVIDDNGTAVGLVECRENTEVEFEAKLV